MSESIYFKASNSADSDSVRVDVNKPLLSDYIKKSENISSFRSAAKSTDPNKKCQIFVKMIDEHVELSQLNSILSEIHHLPQSRLDHSSPDSYKPKLVSFNNSLYNLNLVCDIGNELRFTAKLGRLNFISKLHVSLIRDNDSIQSLLAEIENVSSLSLHSMGKGPLCTQLRRLVGSIDPDINSYFGRIALDASKISH
jgi:hypothetical protein